MPKIDLQYSHDALPAASVGPLSAELTGLLLRHRGQDDTPRARAGVWSFAREERAFVDGAGPAQPLVAITISLFSGGIDDGQVEALVADATEAVRAITPDARVWLVVQEVPRARWGVEGRILPPPG